MGNCNDQVSFDVNLGESGTSSRGPGHLSPPANYGRRQTASSGWNPIFVRQSHRISRTGTDQKIGHDDFKLMLSVFAHLCALAAVFVHPSLCP